MAVVINDDFAGHHLPKRAKVALLSQFGDRPY